MRKQSLVHGLVQYAFEAELFHGSTTQNSKLFECSDFLPFAF